MLVIAGGFSPKGLKGPFFRGKTGGKLSMCLLLLLLLLFSCDIKKSRKWWNDGFKIRSRSHHHRVSIKSWFFFFFYYFCTFIRQIVKTDWIYKNIINHLLDRKKLEKARLILHLIDTFCLTTHNTCLGKYIIAFKSII